MKVFLSYPSAQRELALRLKLALEAEGHDLFFDRDDLPAGEAFHQRIREQLQAADLFVFLVAPASMAAGGYARAELALAEARWPRPHRHVLPVVVAPTPKSDIPPYLLAVTLLEPQGDVVAETVARVAAMAPNARPWWTRPARVAGVVLGLLLALALGVWQVQHQRQQATRMAAQLQLADEARRALQVCQDGSAADGFAQLRTLAARAGAPPAVPAALQDCAMQWLRRVRTIPDSQTWARFAAPLSAVLAEALATTPPPTGPRAGDLRAHQGWATYLTWLDKRPENIDPSPSYRQALQDDPDNVYALAMSAHWALQRTVDPAALQTAMDRFGQAMRSGRDAAFVRWLQWSTVMSDGRAGVAMRLADEMRRQREPMDEAVTQRLWGLHFSAGYHEEVAAPLLQALPPAEGLATFLWLFPKSPPGMHAGSMDLWHLMHARFLLAAGNRDAARAELLPLQQQHRRDRSTGSLPDAVDRLLATR